MDRKEIACAYRIFLNINGSDNNPRSVCNVSAIDSGEMVSGRIKPCLDVDPFDSVRTFGGRHKDQGRRQEQAKNMASERI